MKKVSLIPSNFDCTEVEMTKLQMEEAINNMYFKYNPTSSYEKLPPELKHVYNSFELCTRTSWKVHAEDLFGELLRETDDQDATSYREAWRTRSTTGTRRSAASTRSVHHCEGYDVARLGQERNDQESQHTESHQPTQEKGIKNFHKRIECVINEYISNYSHNDPRTPWSSHNRRDTFMDEASTYW
eukprot:5980262-Amphidinium_carterae.3